MTVAVRENLCLDWLEGETGSLCLLEMERSGLRGEDGAVARSGRVPRGIALSVVSETQRLHEPPGSGAGCFWLVFWSGMPAPTDASVGSRRRVGKG
jgi:hypothetical protein